MNEYLKGAYESLSWVKSILREDGGCEKVLVKVDKVLQGINEEVATDFIRRIKPITS